MSYDKNRLAELLKTIYEFTFEGVEDPHKYRACQILGGSGTAISITTEKGTMEGAVGESGGPTLMTVDDGVEALGAFADEVLKDDVFREIIGRAAINEQLKNLLRSTNGKLPDEDTVSIVRQRITKPLRDEIREWQTYVPIVNLQVTSRLRLGDVEFVPVDETRSAARTFIEEQPLGSDDPVHQGEQRQSFLAYLDKSYEQATSFARVELRAHKSRAPHIAADKALIALNILRAHTHLLHRRDDKAFIGLASEIPSAGAMQTVSLSQDDSHSFNMKNSYTGPLRPFTLDEAKIDHLKDKCHLAVVQGILDKPSEDRNPFESAVIQAFQSLGRAIVAPTIDMRFLGCTIALERMLIRDGEETTTERWTDRLAFAVEADPELRPATIKKAKRLYDLRSKIVHAAHSGVLEIDAQQIERWAMGAILVGLKGHGGFESHQDFCDSVDPRMIALGVDKDTPETREARPSSSEDR